MIRSEQGDDLPLGEVIAPLSRLIPLSELIPPPLSILIGLPLSTLIPDKNKLITINLIRMIFILLWFCAGRKDLLPGVYRRHSRGNVLVRRLVASRTPPFRTAQQSVISLQVGIVPGFGLDVSQAQRIIGVAKSPLRCARNYHLTNQLPLIDHLIS